MRLYGLEWCGKAYRGWRKDGCKPVLWNFGWESDEKLDIEEEQGYFQQNNDPKCTSWLATTWFSDNNIIVIHWPAQSPDLNPIEPLWYYVKCKLQEYEIPPKGMHELWETVAKEWDEICSLLFNLGDIKTLILTPQKYHLLPWKILGNEMVEMSLTSLQMNPCNLKSQIPSSHLHNNPIQLIQFLHEQSCMRHKQHVVGWLPIFKPKSRWMTCLSSWMTSRKFLFYVLMLSFTSII